MSQDEQHLRNPAIALDRPRALARSSVSRQLEIFASNLAQYTFEVR